MKIETFGSVCSGIEAARFVLKPLGLKPLWLSEIEDFPCKFLANNYPDVPNVGDMNDIPQMIENGEIPVPDLLCGGTPCQAFSWAGWRQGVNDDRGQLTLKFFDILNRMDDIRLKQGQNRAVCFWENVEGVLTDNENAFGYFLAGLAGLDNPICSSLEKRFKTVKKDGHTQKIEVAAKWPNAGVLHGKIRNIAWRVLDAKYFGLPQQRKRIYVVAGGKEFNPEQVLFEMGDVIADPFKIKGQIEKDPKEKGLFDEIDFSNKVSIDTSLTRKINGYDVEVFRTYTDCLYAAYGTKWNGNAAALNGSLFVSQNGRIRRMTPLETERIMGFPDNYTLLPKCRDTQRYKATGNSWAINVIHWITNRLCNYDALKHIPLKAATIKDSEYSLFLFNEFVQMNHSDFINASAMPYEIKTANILDFIDTNADEKFYISPAGCAGIIRRKEEHNSNINPRLEIILRNCSMASK